MRTTDRCGTSHGTIVVFLFFFGEAYTQESGTTATQGCCGLVSNSLTANKDRGREWKAFGGDDGGGEI